MSTPLEQLHINGRSIVWHRHPRRRRAALRFEAGRVSLHTPQRFPLSLAQQFVSEQENWLSRQESSWQAQPPAPSWQPQEGTLWPFLGEQLRLRLDLGGRQVYRDQGCLVLGCEKIPSDAARYARIKAWYRQQAVELLSRQFELWRNELGYDAGELNIRRYKRRWGSCHSDGRISLNWCLVMAPQAVLDYVIIHELCHLVVFDHSPAFWQLVEQYCPQWRAHRRWLRDYAHIIDFPEQLPKLNLD